jgi:hypothetical protein
MLCLTMDATAQESECRRALTTSGTADSPITAKLDDIQSNPEEYYGKTVTVDGELHRTFTDNVFTIEDDDFFNDDDFLVISPMSMAESVIPLGDELEPGENVRVTGVVQPYDRGKLECAYGPLNLESREGHSFTKNPVIIVEQKAAAVECPACPTPQAVIETPAEPLPAAEPEPIPAAPEPVADVPEPEAPQLPRTAGNLPLLAVAGLLALFGSRIKF